MTVEGESVCRRDLSYLMGTEFWLLLYHMLDVSFECCRSLNVIASSAKQSTAACLEPRPHIQCHSERSKAIHGTLQPIRSPFERDTIWDTRIFVFFIHT